MFGKTEYRKFQNSILTIVIGSTIALTRIIYGFIYGEAKLPAILPRSRTVSGDTCLLQAGASVSPSCANASDEEPMNNPG